MTKRTIGIIYVVVMIASVVGMDVAFLRHQPEVRLLGNIGMVLAFGLVYLLAIRRLGR